MIELASDNTEILATNFWFGSELSALLTAGTDALAGFYADALHMRQFSVDCTVENRIEHRINHFRYYLDAFHRVREHLMQRKPRNVVTLGGGCAAAIAVLPYLHSIHPDLRIVWIDAHFDLHLPSTSSSHYIHGMTVGILTNPEWYGRFFGDPWYFDPQHVLFCGQKSSDSYERQFIERRSLSSVPPGRGLEAAVSSGATILKGHPVYIHLDLDSLRPGIYPNPKCRIDAGLEFDDLLGVVSSIQRTSEVVGYSIAENAEPEEPRVREVVDIFRKLHR